MNRNKIRVETTVSADINKAWDYWTEPKHIMNWNFASDDWHCPHAENDIRTGGKFKSRMASKDDTMAFDFEGVYDEVINGQKIAYTMPDRRQVIVEFESLSGGATRVIELFDAEQTNSEEMQRAGWQAILDNYKKYVESD